MKVKRGYLYVLGWEAVAAPAGMVCKSSETTASTGSMLHLVNNTQPIVWLCNIITTLFGNSAHTFQIEQTTEVSCVHNLPTLLNRYTKRVTLFALFN